MDQHIKQIVSKVKNGSSPQEILNHLKKSPLARTSYERFLHFEGSCYTRNLVYKCQTLEALLLCWKPGHNTVIHDHASQSCWMTVLEGIITSENYAYVPPSKFTGELQKVSVQSFKTGESYYIDDSVALHLLKNPVRSSEPAVTLHLYARPFSSCTAYDIESGTARELELRYHSINGKRGSWRACDVQSTESL